MSTPKRSYHSESRQAKAELTKKQILGAAKQMFSQNGFEKTTINDVAKQAGVSAPSIYALFKSKEGLLRELMNATLFGAQYKELVEKALSLTDPEETLKMAANITRTIYDIRTQEIGLGRGVSVVSPELKKLEDEAECQRYERQAFIVTRLEKAGLLPEGMDISQARDILWTLTSGDLYRMFVLERGWSSEQYEAWLSQTLLRHLHTEIHVGYKKL